MSCKFVQGDLRVKQLREVVISIASERPTDHKWTKIDLAAAK